MSVKIDPYNSLKEYNFSSSSLVAMVPLLGAHSSKMFNSDKPLEEGCEINSEIEYHKDGSKTVTKTLSCSVKERYDKTGKLVRKTDTFKPRFQAVQRDFFGGSSGAGSSSAKIVKRK